VFEEDLMAVSKVARMINRELGQNRKMIPAVGIRHNYNIGKSKKFREHINENAASTIVAHHADSPRLFAQDAVW